ncbi:MAG: hypothetical protein UT32_C0020G0011 [Parcubacteria group bacterium GW2011_GWC2_39_14]|nr:MAG: hypothetical protein UT32_C0020G0011 [Parcubacteria group bacterium GW2011_GWC2_39_14]KKR54124.1 MAG: hypothetical protein UT91_C0020G0011 [Parcubacteria group bacterium GW2011_GWA2_40_23]
MTNELPPTLVTAPNPKENLADTVLAIWEAEASSILKPKEGLVTNWEDKQLGPARNLTFQNKVGETINAEETLNYNGQSFKIKISANGKTIAFLHYVTNGERVNIGEVDVVPACKRCGLNTRMFADMCQIHPNANCVWQKLDSDNDAAYMRGLEAGLNTVNAARQTPAGKVSERAGWEIDSEQSQLPNLESESLTVRLVYKRNLDKKDS